MRPAVARQIKAAVAPLVGLSGRARWVIRLVLGAVLLWIVFRSTDLKGLAATLLATPTIIVAFVLQTIVGISVESRRLQLLFACFGPPPRFTRLTRLASSAAFFSQCVPGGTGGDLLKFVYLGNHGLARTPLAAILLVDRFIGLVSLLLVASAFCLAARLEPGASMVARWGFWAGLFGVGLIIALVLCFWIRAPWIERFRDGVVRRLPFERIVGSFVNTIIQLRDHRGAVLRALLWSMVGQTVMGLAFMVAGMVLMPGIAGPLVAGLSLISLVANAIPITPGGLGVGEAAFEAAFRLAGQAGGANLMLAWRIGLVPMIVAGAISYLVGLSEARAGVAQEQR